MSVLKQREGLPVQISLNDECRRMGSLEAGVDASIAPIVEAIDGVLGAKRHAAVAIGGGSASGKTGFFTPALTRRFKSTQVISEDDYCVGNSVSAARHGTPNLHVPEDYDPELLAEHIARLKRGEAVDDKPVYSYEIRERVGRTRVNAAQVLIVEGEFLLHPPLSDQFDVKVFVSTDDHSRFVRRMMRPRRNPNQTDLARIREYFELSFPFYHSHLEPTKGNADITIHNQYEPREGFERIQGRVLEAVLTGENVRSVLATHTFTRRNQFTRSYYTHPHCTDSETVCVVTNDSARNCFIYSPGDSHVNGTTMRPFVHFDLGDESLDLCDIGYGWHCDVKGEEWVLKTEAGVSVRLFNIEGGKSAIYLSSENSDSAFSILKKRFENAGSLNASSNFDKWVLPR